MPTSWSHTNTSDDTSGTGQGWQYIYYRYSTIAGWHVPADPEKHTEEMDGEPDWKI